MARRRPRFHLLPLFPRLPDPAAHGPFSTGCPMATPATAVRTRARGRPSIVTVAASPARQGCRHPARRRGTDFGCRSERGRAELRRRGPVARPSPLAQQRPPPVTESDARRLRRRCCEQRVERCGRAAPRARDNTRDNKQAGTGWSYPQAAGDPGPQRCRSEGIPGHWTGMDCTGRTAGAPEFKSPLGHVTAAHIACCRAERTTANDPKSLPLSTSWCLRARHEHAPAHGPWGTDGERPGQQSGP